MFATQLLHYALPKLLPVAVAEFLMDVLHKRGRREEQLSRCVCAH